MVVLAAGQGQRMRSARPKVLHLLGGRPLLRHVLSAVEPLHPSLLAVVYGHGGAELCAKFPEPGIAWVAQAEQRGTGHAAQQALTLIEPRGTVLVLCGDVPLLQTATLRRLVAGCSGERLSLLTQRVADPTGYGRILRDAEGYIRGIREHKDATAEELRIDEVNTGILALPAGRLATWLQRLECHNAQGEFYLTDVVEMAVGEGVEVNTVSTTTPWEAMGVNDKAQLALLERQFQLEQAQGLLSQGVTLSDPARIEIRGKLECERDVLIDVGCVFEGEVKLQAGVRVGPYSVVRNSQIAAGTQIEAFSHIDGAQLGEVNRIGPYARIRPGTVTARAVHVGNFVELKNSSLGEQSKSNHLSYLGDCSIGARVNIGAGTITCNYDGVNKYRTVIEDDVFVGSDTQLVAPVTLQKGATIGAGSTIVRDAPANKLTLSRAPQTTLPRWQRPRGKNPL